MSFLNICKSAVLAVGLTAGSAYAATVDFLVGTDTEVNDISACLGCDVTVMQNLGLEGTAFSLNPGQTQTLAFFDITAETNNPFGAIGVYGVDATLAFADPGGSASSVGGGGFINLAGSISLGALVWDQHEFTIGFGNGGQYTVMFDQGIDLILGTATTVYANVRLDASPVPLPASALLLLAGVGGLGAMRFRKKKPSAA